MSRHHSGSNTILAALKSMVAGERTLSGKPLRSRNDRRNRSWKCSLQTEVCESRTLLTLTVGPNVDISQFAGNEDESAIIVNPNDPMQLFASSNHEAGGLLAKYSSDGGLTWQNSNGNDELIADGNDNLVDACCDPTLAWDTFGNLYISYISGDLNEIPIAISTDGGATFAPLTSISGGNVDQPTLTTGPGLNGADQSLWITYDQGGTQARGASVTGLGAVNVGALGAAQAVTGVQQFGDIAVGPNGQVTVTGQNSNQIQVNTDPDGLGPQGFSGMVVATSTNVDTFDAIPAQARRTIDAESGLVYDRSGGPNNGRLYLVYTDEVVDENDDTEIFVRSSDDNGATWSPRVRVNDDVTTRSQFFCKIALDQTTGDVAAVWYDARNSPGNNTVQLFGSISNDGGVTWEANTVISQGVINGTVGATGGQQLGDYIGLTFDQGVIHPSWSDNSNSTGDNPDGTLAELDILTAAITTGPPPIQFTVSSGSVFENLDNGVPGSGGFTGTVIRPKGSPTTAPLVVTLTSDDRSELRVPATVTIPIGSRFRTFPITVVDDRLLDGTQTVTLTASAVSAGQPTTVDVFVDVLDYETLAITAVPDTVREDAGRGAARLYVTRSNIDITQSLTVQLASSDTTELTVPVQVVIPAGRRRWSVGATAVDDAILDGTQVAIVSASHASYVGTSTVAVSVTESETLGVDILDSSIYESDGADATTARVYRTNVDGPFSYTVRQKFKNNTSKSILDFDKTTSRITVPGQASRVTDVNVTLSLTHSFLGDLDIYLVSPSGTRVELVTDLVSNEEEMTNTTFDNVARQSILDGSSPYTGKFLPEGDLLDLNGEDPSGVWTLEITDDNVEDFGTLISWGLDIETVGLAPLRVALIPTGNAGEILAPQFVTIPGNQAELLVPIDALDDNLLDGTQVSGLRPSVNRPYAIVSDSVNVLDDESLRFTVSSSGVSEAAGPGALTGRITRLNSNIKKSFTVAVSSSDTSELTVPATVTIPAGKSFAEFLINAIDDNKLDGPQSVTLKVSSPAYREPQSQVVIVDDLEPSLHLTSDVTSVREDAGSFRVTVSRQDDGDLSKAVRVALSVVNVSHGAAPLSVPAFVTIKANQTSQDFTATVKDDRLLDGTQLATIRATATNIIEGSAEFRITDHETLSLTVSQSSIREDNGRGAATGRVTRSNTDRSRRVVVTLTSSDIGELRVPLKVTIPAGAAGANFDINAINDPVIDGTQLVTISGEATKYFGGSVNINVEDHEPPVVIAPGAQVTNPLPLVKWKAVPNALRYDLELTNLTTNVKQLYPSILGTRFTPPESLGIGRYQVIVRAVDQLERPGYWSNPREFMVETAPRLTAPVPRGNVVVGTFPEIAWTAVIDASGYELIVDNNTTGVDGVISQRNLRTTSYLSPDDFGSGVYTATVRAFNSQKEFGQWSKPFTFTVLASPQVLTPVTGGSFERTPTLSWSRISGATSYDVRVINVQTRGEVFRDRFVTTRNIRIPRDLANGDYVVRVRSQNGTSFSVWSEPRPFSIGSPPVVTSPRNGQSVDSRPKIVWTSISGTERYELQIRDVDSGRIVVSVDNVPRTNYVPMNELPLGRYAVVVKAVSTLGEKTDWSKPVEFNAGSVPIITDPSNNGTTGQTPLIAWSAVDGALRYKLELRNADTGALVLARLNIRDLNYTVPTALARGSYRVWVRAINAFGRVSGRSSAVDFTVADSAAGAALPRIDGNEILTSALIADSFVADGNIPSFAAVTDRHGNEVSDSPAPDSHHEVFAEELIADTPEIEAIHDAVMSDWDASAWWNA